MHQQSNYSHNFSNSARPDQIWALLSSRSRVLPPQRCTTDPDNLTNLKPRLLTEPLAMIVRTFTGKITANLCFQFLRLRSLPIREPCPLSPQPNRVSLIHACPTWLLLLPARNTPPLEGVSIGVYRSNLLPAINPVPRARAAFYQWVHRRCSRRRVSTTPQEHALG